MVRPSKIEFPNLAGEGLYAAKTSGNGNCLFNALSDQLYGSEDRHSEIRAAVIGYIRQHKAHYIKFMDAVSGGAQPRRNPKRKVTGVYQAPVSATPSPEQMDAAFEKHLHEMAKGGVWGGNIEVAAFTEQYQVDVLIHGRNEAPYFLRWGRENGRRPAGQKGKLVHIAFHNQWCHYSTVRNLSGPHSGMPHTEPTTSLPLQNEPDVAEWKIEAILNSVPTVVDRDHARDLLLQHGGKVDSVVTVMMEAAAQSYSSSVSDGSSSIERDLDTDDEEPIGPNKRRAQRLRKAAATLLNTTTSRDPASVLTISRTGRAKIEAHRISTMQERHIVDLTESDDGAATVWQPARRALKPQDDDTSASSCGTETSQSSFSQSTSSTSSTSDSVPIPNPRKAYTAKPSTTKRPTARERKVAQKAAQKAAARLRKQSKATPHEKSSQRSSQAVKTERVGSQWTVERPMRTLEI